VETAKYTLLLLILISTRISAQDFGPIGAIWHYNQALLTGNGATFTSIESVSDTIIANTNCRKLVEVQRHNHDTVWIRYHYLHTQNDSVLFYTDGGFHLLYDFSAQAGDTLVLDYFKTINGSPLEMIIDSTGVININSKAHRIQHIRCGDGIFIEFGSPVIEGIGSTWFLFPVNDMSVTGPLRCYTGFLSASFINTFYFVPFWNNSDCDQVILSINENESQHCTPFPNPAGDLLSIPCSRQNHSYEVYGIEGSLRQMGLISEFNTIPLATLAPGLYFLRLYTNVGSQVFRIVKQ
jgi:hypothetical protein